MPRIPNGNDCSSVWKINDQYVARNGDEWPKLYAPTQHYIRRQGGTWGNMTDGLTTNAYPVTNPGAANLMDSQTQSFTGGYCDVLAWEVYSSYATTYQINAFSLGAVSTTSSVEYNNGNVTFMIVNGYGMGGSTMYHKTWSHQQLGFAGYGSSYANTEGAAIITLPATDDWGNPIPTMAVGNWYSGGFAFQSNQSWYAYRGTNFDYLPNGNLGRQITTGGGTVDLRISSCPANGSWPWGNSNGTGQTYGQMPIFGIIV